ncbi:iron-sulfur cluster assembly scaffold protein [Desulforhopalus vacuolatus]|uniref:iron-sulfur cluster assembly scaffold protein n=1 Tax=Desulforhopalus vacuolatus TaxID=40414 RepID=UPI00196438BB|nr:iron-sulfur cluster assembly scaffold protein [Desulforhopalus vacuolatus]MBM9519261.1 iron-sulfur cluster assembly scaffold protein [Desulforhopalus vacuolatus]
MGILQNFIPQHSDHFQKMVARTERYGKLEEPDGYGTRTGDCGDTVEMFIAVQDGCLQQVNFCIDGCNNTMAAANTVSLLMEGRNPDDGWALTPEKVADYLVTLPPNHFHCAELAVGAFYNALNDYNTRQKK